MLRLDTIKLKVQGVPPYAEGRFKRGFRPVAQGERERPYLEAKPAKSDNVHGLSSITIENDSVEINLSAKVLGKDYPQLVTLDNIDRVSDAISDFVEIGPQGLLRASVLRADVTNDLHLSEGPGAYVKALGTLQGHRNYHVDLFPGSVVFRAKAKSNSERLVCYDKAQDMLKADNRAFLERVGSSVYKRFEGVLRVEQNCRSYKAVRRVAGVAETTGTPTLHDVLTSKERPNVRLFDKVATRPDVQGLFDEVAGSGYKWGQYVKFKGYESIIRTCDFDERLIRDLIRQASKGNPSYYMPEVRKWITYLRAEGRETQYRETRARIDELRQALRLAA